MRNRVVGEFARNKQSDVEGAIEKKDIEYRGIDTEKAKDKMT
jgi:hypothetical protein